MSGEVISAETRTRRRAHLVLSGGGVNCLGFVGALEALERGDRSGCYEWASISTCSLGTLIGAWRSVGVTPAEMRLGIERFNLRSLRSLRRANILRRLPRLRNSPALLDESPVSVLFDAVNKLTPSGRKSEEIRLDELDPPLAAAAVDVDAHRLIVLSKDVRPSMSVRQLLNVTTAVPPLVAPVRMGQHDVVDASVSWSAPIWLTSVFEEPKLPIVVLRTGGPPAGLVKRRSVFAWLLAAQRAGISSHDSFHIDQTPRVLEFVFARLHKPHARLSPRQRVELMDAGRELVEDQLERRSSSGVPAGPRLTEEAALASVLHRRHRPADAATVFISYAREDEKYVAAVRHHLRRLIARESIDVWDDSYIKSGDDWDWTIRDAIERSRAAILLVSEHFNASDYIRDRELDLLLARNESGQTRLFVVQVDGAKLRPELRRVQWWNNEPLSEAQEGDRAEILATLTRAIEELFVS